MKGNRLSRVGPMHGAKVTIEDIARAAHVHPASVSRALGGATNKVSAKTRGNIERIALEMGYRPNAIAASLRTKRSNLVGVVVPDLGNPLFGPLVQGIESELRQQGLLCLIVQTPSQAAARADVVVALADRQVSGLLILAAENDDPLLAAAERLRLPTVLVNRGFGERRFPSVVNDDRESVRLVLDHLVALGHRSVAHVAGPDASSTGHARRLAFIDFCDRLGLESVVVEAAAFTRAAGLAAVSPLLDRPPSFTAIFGANDLIAMGVLDALHRCGLAIPADMSVVGHNDMPFVDLIAPPLTTVRIAADQMSRQSAQLLLEQMKAPDQDPTMRVLTPRLIVRGSTAAPRGGEPPP